MNTSRFTTKRDGLDYVVKDNVTGQIIGRFYANKDHPDMPKKYAHAAAAEFNRLHAQTQQYKKRRNW